MLLYEDKSLFRQAVSATADYFKVEPSIVEKDYYLTLFLKRLTERLPHLLFKGGTSLSKCYKVIHRFSEDLDISLFQDTITQGQRKQVKQAIKTVCADMNLMLLNEEDTRSRRNFNRYEIDYSPEQEASAIRPVLLVETTYMVKSYPAEQKLAAAMIYDYMAAAGQPDLVSQYDLQPFSVAVQTMDRTLIDKIFALCDYYLTDHVPGHSRHMYDISCLVKEVSLDSDFISLFRKVRADRRREGGSQCISAKEEYSISALLTEILEKGVYREDYHAITDRIVFAPVSYEEAMESVKVLIASGTLG